MPKIMKLTDMGCDNVTVQRYIEDDTWIMQQKFDGTRIQVTLNEEGEYFWSNDGVKTVTHSAAKLKLPALEEILEEALGHFRGFVTLEGELLIRTGEYILWDMIPSHDDYKIEEKGWHDRHLGLEKFFNGFLNGNPLVKLSPTAFSTSAKQTLWDLINRNNVEGAVSKHTESFYIPGVRTKDWVKHKLVKTADLVVTRASRTFKPNGVVEKGNAALAYYNSTTGDFVDFTAASLIGKDLTIEPGDVVEVAYLYREPGGSIVQPRIIQKRWDAKTSTGDKRPEDCTIDQFPEYSRQVVTL